ncbi:MAG: CesT family type III secretion system chaperone [Deltaproteobacteria bacterium]|jgi:type III secretion system chaperone SycN|nr:CesT family type III secretion system chaperone [Deltaproteobacteria bacterium]
MLERAITEFGQRLGLGTLTLSPGRPLTLKIDRLGSLTLELAKAAPEVLMSLAAPLAPYDRSVMRRALETCSYDRNRPLALAAGCQADYLLLMARLPVSGIQGRDLERAAETLMAEMRILLTGDGK